MRSLLEHARVSRLSEGTIPELAGFERFAAAARGDYSSKEAVLDNVLEEQVVRAVQAPGVVHFSHPYTFLILPNRYRMRNICCNHVIAY